MTTSRFIVFMLSSQTGKSISIDAMLGYCIACEPGPMLHVITNGARSEDFVRDRFDPLVSASTALRALVGTGQDTPQRIDGRREFAGLESFPEVKLNFASSHSPDELAARRSSFYFSTRSTASRIRPVSKAIRSASH